MPTYNAKCPKCQHEQEYFCSMGERERGEALPKCEKCDTQTEKAATFNDQGGFILKGPNWFGHSKGSKRGY